MKTTNIFRIFCFLILSSVIVAGISSCKKDNISKGLGGFDPTGDIVIMALGLSDNGMETDPRFMDVLGGKVYDLDGASAHPENIDFALFYDQTTGYNLITPQDINNLSKSEIGRVMNNTWLNKNKATLFKLESSDAATNLFKNVNTSKEIKETYEQTLNSLSGTSDPEVFGPGKSLKNVKKGDLIFFYSEDRQFHALLKVFKTDQTKGGVIEFEIKMDNNSAKQVQPADQSNLMTIFETTFQGPGQTSGTRYLDFSTGITYNNVEVMQNQEKIDFVCFNSSASGSNMIVPSDETSLNGFGGGRTMNSDWLVKNDGVLLKLNASSESDSLFLFTINNEMIRAAYESVEQNIANTSEYDEELNGPGGRIQSVNEGDLLLFKSASRNLMGLAKVTGIVSGNSGSVTLSVKVDNSNKKDIPAPPNRELDMSSEGYATARFIDLVGGADYDEAEAKPISEKIDLIFAKGSSTYINVFPTNNEAGLKAFSSSIWPGRISEWDARNDVLLINLGTDPVYETLREGRLDDMKQAYEDAGDPSARLTRIKKNDVILIYSVDRKFYAAIKVIDATNDGNFRFKYKVAKE